MLAVIKTGGKQYRVSPKDKLKIEKIVAEEGSEVVFDNVLLVENGKDLTIGEPMIKGMTVTAKVLKHAKADKVMTFKYKSKKRYKVKKGHRQQFTEVEIIDIK
ncbi:50S ribosomal protein L21 [bacterium]|jgi:large subunit ribosomal protein L21|nr:50S ribosomal protein L21 [bacterium]